MECKNNNMATESNPGPTEEVLEDLEGVSGGAGPKGRLRCPRCGHDNPSFLSYCEVCGARLLDD